jgi:aspartyl-tRNA(Asn)/glutamyl-tRNA(Gln) amidotransferase subunit C
MLKREDLEHLANLARLQLTAEEKDSLMKDLEKILEYVSQIKEADLKNFDSLISIFESTKLREDEFRRGEHESHEIVESIKNNFPSKDDDGYLKVPKVIDKDQA